MARIIVTADTPSAPHGSSVLLDESVEPVHISSEHGAVQLIQRLRWAVGDATELERPRLHRSQPSRQHAERSDEQPDEQPQAVTRYSAASALA